MPRKQDFSQSIIYHIRNIETKKVIYVGSTTKFQDRKAKHKYICNNEGHKNHNFLVYCFIRENGGFNNFEVIPVSILNLQNKVQLVIEEQNEIDKHNNLKNSKKSYQTTEERKEYVRNYNEGYNREYRETHKEILKQKSDEYRELNKEILNNKKKIYYNNNKEQLKEKFRKVYEDNKEYMNEKINCSICNATINRQGLRRHQRTKKCMEHIKNETSP